jgi:D-lactate dehydrogenase
MALLMAIAEHTIQLFVSLLGADRVLTDPADRLTYGYDNSREQALPDLVVFPDNHDDVVAIIQCCHEHKIPVTCRGRGTGTTGATVPVGGGLVLSTERMTRILEMAPQ